MDVARGMRGEERSANRMWHGHGVPGEIGSSLDDGRLDNLFPLVGW